MGSEAAEIEVRDFDAARQLRPWLVPVVAMVVLGVLYGVSVRSGWGQRIDEYAVIHHRYDRTSDADARVVSRLLSIASVMFAPVLLCRVRRDALARAACVAVLLATVSAEVVRRAAFARPVLTGSDSLNGPSFPSGHATAAMAIALAIALVVPASPRLRLASLALAMGVGAVAVYVPIHRVSDVVGGYLLALVCIGALAVLRPRPSVRISGASYLAVVVAAVAVVLGGAVLGARRAGLSLSDFGRAFPIGIVVVAVGAALVAMAFEREVPLSSGLVERDLEVV
ncbi:phosphatase PAP2 family protein [Aquihabitans sp. McL0605]|uniref:phosphatase PAP2 family protein n=1 Tax=Aquihabitans sp. McL0605 TaxID=3415671 RepID=UPI003CF7DB2B